MFGQALQSLCNYLEGESALKCQDLWEGMSPLLQDPSRTELVIQPEQRKRPEKAVVAQNLSQGITALLLSALHPICSCGLHVVEEFRETSKDILKPSECFSTADKSTVGLARKGAFARRGSQSSWFQADFFPCKIVLLFSLLHAVF